MGLEKRLLKLEADFGVGTGTFKSYTDLAQAQRERVVSEALRRLTDVELTVLVELLELRCRHLDLSGTRFYRLMSDIYRAMERRWRRVMKEAGDELTRPA